MALIGTAVIVALLVISILNAATIVLEVVKIWMDMFGDRASLNSEYGRFTIWKANLEYLIQNGKEWFGVGQNQIYLLTGRNLACHNTWLEWICVTGVFL